MTQERERGKQNGDDADVQKIMWESGVRVLSKEKDKIFAAPRSEGSLSSHSHS